jgi:hypothetical protein
MTPCIESVQSESDFAPPIRRLLAHLIDYAGLYPPAALKMTSAVNNYASYRAGENTWALGNFVVNAARLEEFENETGEYLPAIDTSSPWRLSALCGPLFEEDFRTVEAFNRRHEGLRVTSLEMKATSPDDIAPLMAGAPAGMKAYFEFPLSVDAVPFVRALARVGAHAKVRTGGSQPNMFPSTAELCGFLNTCCRYNVAFKATAGLHHPFCGQYRLSYDAADTRTVGMHGFLNVFLSAIFMYAGIRPEFLPELLTAETPQEFAFDERGITWRHHWASNEQIDEARACFAVAFGSCSFDEPLRALRHLGVLQ